MKLEHVAIWVEDIEKMKEFYVKYFDAIPNEKYVNPRKAFSSYFLSFHGGARLEIMTKVGIDQPGENQNKLGITHVAFSLGTKEKVDELTLKLSEAGYEIVGSPRTTGDGYYESVIKDPEGNHIEITS